MPVSDIETNKGGSFWPLEPYTDQILKRTNLLHSAIESTYCMPKTSKQKLDKNQPKKKQTRTNKQKIPKPKHKILKNKNKKDQKRSKTKIFSIVVNKKRQKSAFFQHLFWNCTSDTKPIQYVQWRQIRWRK